MDFFSEQSYLRLYLEVFPVASSLVVSGLIQWSLIQFELCFVSGGKMRMLISFSTCEYSDLFTFKIYNFTFLPCMFLATWGPEMTQWLRELAALAEDPGLIGSS